MKTKKLVAIVGGIAVGKTTVGHKILESVQGVRFIEEDVSQNEFLQDFYADMKRWAFHSRISTLAMIASNYIVDEVEEDFILMDRCLDELITFAGLQYDKGNLSQREFKVYTQLYNDLIRFAPPIAGYIYCHCDSEISMDRIKNRNRDFEQRIDIAYLNDLNAIYDKWIKTLETNRVLSVDTGESIDMDEIKQFIEEI